MAKYRKPRKPQIRERPEDVRPGDEIHAAKLVDVYIAQHPEEAVNRDALIAAANRVGMIRKRPTGEWE